MNKYLYDEGGHFVGAEEAMEAADAQMDWDRDEALLKKLEERAAEEQAMDALGRGHPFEF